MSEFDEFAENYDVIHKKNLGSLVRDLHSLARYKVKLTEELIGMHPNSILEFGCGTGRNLPFLRDAFPNATISAYDVSDESIAIAKNSNPRVHFLDDCFQTMSFDLIFVAGVLHHIPPGDRVKCLKTLKNSLAAAGKIVIFEHNPHNPVTRHLVNTCEFDTDAQLLSLRACVDLLNTVALKSDIAIYTLLFPWRKTFFEKIEKMLGNIPFGGQYCVIGSHF